MGLSAKIFASGMLFFVLSSAIIGFLGSDRDMEIISPWVKAVLVLTWFASLAAMIIGVLIAIWV